MQFLSASKHIPSFESLDINSGGSIKVKIVTVENCIQRKNSCRRLDLEKKNTLQAMDVEKKSCKLKKSFHPNHFSNWPSLNGFKNVISSRQYDSVRRPFLDQQDTDIL